MRNQILYRVSIIPALAMIFLLVLNAFGQEMGSGSYREGYSSYGTMGQNPDEIMEYGRDMMRYGFHEMGMPGGTNDGKCIDVEFVSNVSHFCWRYL